MTTETPDLATHSGTLPAGCGRRHFLAQARKLAVIFRLEQLRGVNDLIAHIASVSKGPSWAVVSNRLAGQNFAVQECEEGIRLSRPPVPASRELFDLLRSGQAVFDSGFTYTGLA